MTRTLKVVRRAGRRTAIGELERGTTCRRVQAKLCNVLNVHPHAVRSGLA